MLNFVLSPAGDRVAFNAASGASGEIRLYTVSVSSGAPAVVGSLLANNTSSVTYAFTPDGARIFYCTCRNDSDGSSPLGTLHSAAATGGPDRLVASNVVRFVTDPTGAHVLYITNGQNGQLHSAPTAGGASTAHGPIAGGEFLISPDGAWVIYRPWSYVGTLPLVSQRVTGGPTNALEDAIFGVIGDGSVQISADSRYVLADGRLAPTNVGEPEVLQLRRVPIDGGAPVVLLVRSPGDVSLTFVQAPGGGPVVFRIIEKIPDPNLVRQTLGSVPLVGGAETILYGPADVSISAVPFKLGEDGSAMLFSDPGGLRRVSTSGGGAPERLSGVRYVYDFDFASDGAALFVEGRGLYRAAPAAPAVRVDGLPAGSFALLGTQAGDALVFRGGRDRVPLEDNTVYELFAADLSAVDSRPFRTSLPFLRR